MSTANPSQRLHLPSINGEMPLRRQWRIQNQLAALNEFNLLKTSPPSGIYLIPTPSNFSIWSGILFVRQGPYSPAVLRFQVEFPQSYPTVPPLITFTSDVFHPLITPLTTYTYSTSTPSNATVSSGDDERLQPGGLSLRHGFPEWFKSSSVVNSVQSPTLGFKDIPSSSNQGDAGQPNHRPTHKRPLSFHIPPPKEDAIDDQDAHPSILQVLQYLRQVFEDEELLDDLSLDMAAHPSAWYAWKAHRRKTIKPLPKIPSGSPGITGTPSIGHGRSRSLHGISSSPATPTPAAQLTQGKKTMADWNWDGVWLDRVKKGISASISDAVLYGNSEGDELIHFLDAEDYEYGNFTEAWMGDAGD